MKEMVQYLWPKGDFGTKLRVGSALGITGWGESLERPGAILLQEHRRFDEHRLHRSWRNCLDGGWLYACCLRCRQGLVPALFQELRNSVFASVAQKAIRNVARNVFAHLLRLDLNFHLTRQTGGLTRALDRGTKGISFLLTSMLFHIFPTILEIGMVCGILTYQYGLPIRWCDRSNNGSIFSLHYHHNVMEN